MSPNSCHRLNNISHVFYRQKLNFKRKYFTGYNTRAVYYLYTRIILSNAVQFNINTGVDVNEAIFPLTRYCIVDFKRFFYIHLYKYV